MMKLIGMKRKRNNEGNSHPAQALIELALVLPIVLLIILGAMDIGRMFFLKMSLVNAAREGSNYLALYPEDSENVYDVIKAEGENTFLNLTIDPLDDVSISGCCTHGLPVEVTVTKSIDLIFDSVLQAFGLIGGPVQLTGVVSMVVQ